MEEKKTNHKTTQNPPQTEKQNRNSSIFSVVPRKHYAFQILPSHLSSIYNSLNVSTSSDLISWPTGSASAWEYLVFTLNTILTVLTRHTRVRRGRWKEGMKVSNIFERVTAKETLKCFILWPYILLPLHLLSHWQPLWVITLSSLLFWCPSLIRQQTVFLFVKLRPQLKFVQSFLK